MSERWSDHRVREREREREIDENECESSGVWLFERTLVEVGSFWTLEGVCFGELFCILVKLFAVRRELLRELGAQRVLGLGVVDERDQCLDHLVRLRRRLPVLGRDDRETHL